MATSPNDVINSPAIRSLIWMYAALLILEGVLRKWLLPSISDPLLLVRDPFLVLIYLIALGNGAFPLNGHVGALLVIGTVAGIAGMTVGSQDPIVTAYGFDCMFFHLPLIFVIPKVMTREHVIDIGRFLFLITLPMAALMAVQFRSPPDALINCGAGGGIGSQMGGALGKIRPPGFFTFITGAAHFLALSTAFLIFGLWKKGIYSRVLLLGVGVSIAVAAIVSTSRLALGAIGTVFLMIGIIVALDRRSMSNVMGMLVPIGIVMVVATNLDIFHEGREVFEARLQNTNDAAVGIAGTASNWTARIFGNFYGGFAAIKDAPALGAGLGVGTNVGARVLSGQFGFLLAEGEWPRVVLELGPFLAMPYLLIRCLICVTLYIEAARSARNGNVLPMLLFGSCALLVTIGQFSQTSTLGFAVLGAGLCLASANLTRENIPAVPKSGEPEENGPSPRTKQRGCSAYAEKLHDYKTVG